MESKKETSPPEKGSKKIPKVRYILILTIAQLTWTIFMVSRFVEIVKGFEDGDSERNRRKIVDLTNLLKPLRQILWRVDFGMNLGSEKIEVKLKRFEFATLFGLLNNLVPPVDPLEAEEIKSTLREINKNSGFPDEIRNCCMDAFLDRIYYDKRPKELSRIGKVRAKPGGSK